MAPFSAVAARLWALAIVFLLLPLSALAAPYAAYVMDARTGQVLHQENANARLHPASLTKMMTMYVVFEAVQNGELSMDDMVTISSKAASEPPSKLGLRTGQRIQLRYLVRAAAVRSANDAATAIGEAVSGSEAAFAVRMNRTAQALGMSRTTFKNAHGLTQAGHLSTAHDMSLLGRALFHHYPQYYNLFSRRQADAGMKMVNHTNRRLLSDYPGADGIKTGFTNAAGFNLTASAERGSERIIATVFGGRSTASRNARVAELLDLGFSKAPTHAAVRMPVRPRYEGGGFAVAYSIRPAPRPGVVPAALAAGAGSLYDASAVAAAVATALPSDTGKSVDARPGASASLVNAAVAAALPDLAPEGAVQAANGSPLAEVPSSVAPPPPAPRDAVAALVAPAVPEPPMPAAETEVVTRVTTSGGRNWGINLGAYNTQYQAEQVLLRTALTEIGTLDDALRKVSRSAQGWEANFLGMSEGRADLACQRLSARDLPCDKLDPDQT